jgi:hypothetical protein
LIITYWCQNGTSKSIQTFTYDPNGAVAAQSYTLTGKQNHAPLINSVPTTQVTIGNTYHYDVVATDADNDALTCAIDNTSKLAGMAISQGEGFANDKLGRIAKFGRVGTANRLKPLLKLNFRLDNNYPLSIDCRFCAV